MIPRALLWLAVLFALPRLACADPAADFLAGKFAWVAGPPLIGPADRPEDPCVAIKDPTIVFVEGRWHVFATIKCKSLTKMEYLSFADWKDADKAPRHVITLVDSYHCAPQVFYFTPQKKWYLLYQWADKSRTPAYFGPCFSTLDDLGKPETLTPPQMLYPEKPATLDKGWIDFWIICDPPEAANRRAHLFFTSNDGRMWRAETKLADFPRGWTPPAVVLCGDIFEASHTYRLKGLNQYLTIIEAQAGGRRYYKAYLADTLDGQWRPLADTLQKPFAARENVTFAPGVQPWTDSISHGELLREGYDETPTVDPAHLRFLYQGNDSAGRAGKGYGQFPWKLGLLEPAP